MRRMAWLSALACLVVFLGSAAADTSIGDPSVTKFTEVKGGGDPSYTGSSGISVPLFNLKGRSGLDFPLALSYSPGIRTHQEAGPAGLGFSLVAGSVQRGVVGFADDLVRQGFYRHDTHSVGAACVDDLSGEIRSCGVGNCGELQVRVDDCKVRGASTCDEALGGGSPRISKYCRSLACVGPNGYVDSCHIDNGRSADDVCDKDAGYRIMEVFGECVAGTAITSCLNGYSNCVPEYDNVNTVARDGALYYSDRGASGYEFSEGLRQDNYFASFPGGAAQLMFYDENGEGSGGVHFTPVSWKPWKIDYSAGLEAGTGISSFTITDDSGVRFIFDEVSDSSYSGGNYPNVEVQDGYDEEYVAATTSFNGHIFSAASYDFWRSQNFNHDWACRKTCICPYPYEDGAGFYHSAGDSVAVPFSGNVPEELYGYLTGDKNFQYQIKFWAPKKETSDGIRCYYEGEAPTFVAKESKGASGGGICGNGIREKGEQCDGADNDFSCNGFTPYCNDDCTIPFQECGADLCQENSVPGNPAGWSCEDGKAWDADDGEPGWYDYGDVDCHATGGIYRVPVFGKCHVAQQSADGSIKARATGVQSDRASHATAWHLTRILSADYGDREGGAEGPSPDDFGSYVEIKYADYGGKIDDSNGMVVSRQLFGGTGTFFSYDVPGEGPRYLQVNSKSETVSESVVKVIDEIRTPLFKAKFHYDSAPPTGGVPQLEDVAVTDLAGQQVSKMKFDYATSNRLKDPDNGGHGERTLLKVTQCGRTDAACLPPTEFNYGDRASQADNPDFSAKAKDGKGLKTINTDPWGFYSGTFRRWQGSGACSGNDDPRCKWVSDENSDAWSLRKITYPTKGTVGYEYESSDYAWTPSGAVQETAGGGPRVKRINANFFEDDNGNPSSTVTEFEYSEGYATQAPFHNNEYYDENSGTAVYSIPWNTVGMVDNYVAYDWVKTATPSDGSMGYTKTYYTTPQEVPDETPYAFKSGVYTREGFQPVPGFLTSNEWKRGHVEKVEVYRSGVAEPVAKTENFYDDPASLRAFPVPGGEFYDESGLRHSTVPAYAILSGWKRVGSEQSTIDGIATRKAYQYNPVNGRVRSVTEFNSPNRITLADYAFEQYPFMLEANMLSQASGTRTYLDANANGVFDGQDQLYAKGKTDWAQFEVGYVNGEWTGDPFWDLKHEFDANTHVYAGWLTSSIGTINNNKIILVGNHNADYGFPSYNYTYNVYVVTDAFGGGITQDDSYIGNLNISAHGNANFVDIDGDGTSELFTDYRDYHFPGNEVEAFKWQEEQWALSSGLLPSELRNLDGTTCTIYSSYGDLDCDGDQDLVIQLHSAVADACQLGPNGYRVFENTGTRFSPSWRLMGDDSHIRGIDLDFHNNIKQFDLGDIDSDGDNDLIYSGSNLNPRVQVYENTAPSSCPKSPVFSRKVEWETGLDFEQDDHVYSVLGGLEHFDNDGRIDLFYNDWSCNWDGCALYPRLLKFFRFNPDADPGLIPITAVHPSADYAWKDADGDHYDDGGEFVLQARYDSYDTFGHATETTDARGNKNWLYYGDNDECGSQGSGGGGGSLNHGYLTCTENSLGQKTKAAYDFTGNPVSITDANGQATGFGYDDLNRLQSKTLSGGVLAEWYSYSYANDIATEKNRVQTKKYLSPSSFVEANAFADGLGRDLQSSVRKQASSSTRSSTVYNALGAVVKRFEAYDVDAPADGYSSAVPEGTQAASVSYYPDPLGRPSASYSVGSAVPVVTTYSGEADQFVTEVTDENGVTTKSYRDKLGRVKTVVRDLGGPDQQTVSYLYDGPTERVKEERMPNGQIISYTYDSLGSLKTITHPDMSGSIANVYDAAGNLIRRTDARGIVVGYDYDALNRRIAVDYGDDQAFGYGESQFSYDAYPEGNCGSPLEFDNPKGRLTRAVGFDPDTGWQNFDYCYEYDGRGLLRREAKEVGGGADNTYVTRYSYDTAGNVKTVTYPGGEVAAYNYNSKGELESFTAPADESGHTTTSYLYNPDGSLGKATYPNSVVTDYAYNARKWVNSISLTGLKEGASAAAWSETIPDGAGGYDPVGNILRINENYDVPNGGGGYSNYASFTYDNLYRLGTVTDGNRFHRGFDYRYDANGNRLREGGTADNYAYDPARKDQLNAVDPGPGTHAVSFGYDANGNVETEEGARNFGFCIARSLGAGSFMLAGVDAPVDSPVNVVYDDGANSYEWGTFPVEAYYAESEHCFADEAGPLSPATRIVLSGPGSGGIPAGWYGESHAPSNFRVYPSSLNPYYQTRYYYDAENRLVQANYMTEAGAVTACSKFTYDSSGDRIEKAEPVISSVVTPPPDGACCAADGSCSLAQQGSCGGAWNGAPSCSPNPCEQPPGGGGVCCWMSGWCTANIAQEDCVGGNEGTWDPDHNTCSPNPCPQYPVGVCCTQSYNFCALTTEAVCSQQLQEGNGIGGWHSGWNSCTPNQCDGNDECPGQLIACGDWYSGFMQPSDTDWYGFHAEAGRQVRIYLKSDQAAVLDAELRFGCGGQVLWQRRLTGGQHVYEDYSAAASGQYQLKIFNTQGSNFGKYTLQISNCGSPPAQGACCAADGSCSLAQQGSCGGAWNGAPSCSPNPCEQPPASGECCLQDESCSLLSQADCVGQGGAYQGGGGACSPNPCQSIDSCAASRTVSCGDTVTPAYLHFNDKDWYSVVVPAQTRLTLATDAVNPGDDTDTYIELYRSCGSQILAQDDNGGPGSYSLISDYVPAYYDDYNLKVRGRYPGSTGPYKVTFTCTAPPADAACCLPGGSCQPLDQTQCYGQGGQYYEGVSCQPNPCGELPLAACCSQDGSCQMLGQNACYGQGGDWTNYGYCSPNPCPPPVPQGRLDYVAQSQGAVELPFLIALEQAATPYYYVVTATEQILTCPRAMNSACVPITFTQPGGGAFAFDNPNGLAAVYNGGSTRLYITDNTYPKKLYLAIKTGVATAEVYEVYSNPTGSRIDGVSAHVAGGEEYVFAVRGSDSSYQIHKFRATGTTLAIVGNYDLEFNGVIGYNALSMGRYEGNAEIVVATAHSLSYIWARNAETMGSPGFFFHGTNDERSVWYPADAETIAQDGKFVVVERLVNGNGGNRVLVLPASPTDPNGIYWDKLAVFGTWRAAGAGSTGVNDARSVAYESSGGRSFIYVADSRNNRVVKLEYTESPAAPPQQPDAGRTLTASKAEPILTFASELPQKPGRTVPASKTPAAPSPATPAPASASPSPSKSPAQDYGKGPGGGDASASSDGQQAAVVSPPTTYIKTRYVRDASGNVILEDRYLLTGVDVATFCAPPGAS
ncbi:MAG: hypothetical protein V1787_01095 [Candidatus Micrarchaeota archaeon]